MFVSKVARLARNVYVRHANASRAVVCRHVNNFPSLDRTMHVTILEVCKHEDGIQKAMELIPVVCSDYRDSSLVAYLSVLDICLERKLIGEALNVLLKINKLGFKLEVAVIEQFLRLSMDKKNNEAIDAVMRTQPLTETMMSAVTDYLITNGQVGLYTEYVKLFLFDNPLATPWARVKVKKIYEKSKQARKTNVILMSRKEKQYFKQIDAMFVVAKGESEDADEEEDEEEDTDNDDASGDKDNLMNFETILKRLGVLEKTFKELMIDQGVNPSEWEDVTPGNDDTTTSSSSASDGRKEGEEQQEEEETGNDNCCVRMNIIDWNTMNVTTELNTESFPEEFQYSHSYSDEDEEEEGSADVSSLINYSEVKSQLLGVNARSLNTYHIDSLLEELDCEALVEWDSDEEEESLPGDLLSEMDAQGAASSQFLIPLDDDDAEEGNNDDETGGKRQRFMSVRVRVLTLDEKGDLIIPTENGKNNNKRSASKSEEEEEEEDDEEVDDDSDDDDDDVE